MSLLLSFAPDQLAPFPSPRIRGSISAQRILISFSRHLACPNLPVPLLRFCHALLFYTLRGAIHPGVRLHAHASMNSPPRPSLRSPFCLSVLPYANLSPP